MNKKKRQKEKQIEEIFVFSYVKYLIFKILICDYGVKVIYVTLNNSVASLCYVE
jgi:hypothetical protein